MGWEEIRKDNQDQASVVVHSSSIALLQERFRQLQKVKEMREEREVVKLLSLSQYPKTHSCCSFFFNNTNTNTNTNTCVVFEPSISNNNPHHESMMMMKKKKVPSSSSTTTTMLTLPPQTSLSLSLTTSSSHDHDRQQSNNIPTLMDLWPVPSSTSTTSSCDSAISFITKLNDHDHHDHHDHDHHYFDSDIEVDTSLHL